jgi:hypothetical protein
MKLRKSLEWMQFSAILTSTGTFIFILMLQIIRSSDHQLGAVIIQDKKQNVHGLLFTKAQYSPKAVNKSA